MCNFSESSVTMSIVLPELPWSKDALAPHISEEVSSFSRRSFGWMCPSAAKPTIFNDPLKTPAEDLSATQCHPEVVSRVHVEGRIHPFKNVGNTLVRLDANGKLLLHVLEPPTSEMRPTSRPTQVVVSRGSWNEAALFWITLLPSVAALTSDLWCIAVEARASCNHTPPGQAICQRARHSSQVLRDISWLTPDPQMRAYEEHSVWSYKPPTAHVSAILRW